MVFLSVLPPDVVREDRLGVRPVDALWAPHVLSLTEALVLLADVVAQVGTRICQVVASVVIKIQLC